MTPSSNYKDVLIYLVQTIVYANWKFRNRATFSNGHDDHRAIIKYVLKDAKFRIHCDFLSLSRTLFYSRWVFPGLGKEIRKRTKKNRSLVLETMHRQESL